MMRLRALCLLQTHFRILATADDENDPKIKTPPSTGDTETRDSATRTVKCRPNRKGELVWMTPKEWRRWQLTDGGKWVHCDVCGTVTKNVSKGILDGN
jgi:hypothetical protein